MLCAVDSVQNWTDADLAVCVSARRVFAVDTETLQEVWEYSSEGERYHYIGRAGERVLVVFSSKKTGKQGLLALDVHQGEPAGVLLPACLPRVHGLAVDREEAVVLTADLAAALPPEVASQVLIELAGREEEDGEPLSDTLSLLGLASTHEGGDAPLWFQILSTESVEEVPEVSITADSGKLYVVRGALLEVHDTLTGRRLGDWTVPGLDEQVAFRVSEGAGLLAEEHRVSVFELPA